MSTENKGHSLALLLIRIWLGFRALISGIEKFAGITSAEKSVTIDGSVNKYGLTSDSPVKGYSIDYYNGIPAPLLPKFKSQPLLPEFLLDIFNPFLGPALIILGVMILLGIFPRVSMFVLGTLFTILTIGLIMIKQDPGVAWLGTHILLIAIALLNSDKDKYALLGKKW